MDLRDRNGGISWIPDGDTDEDIIGGGGGWKGALVGFGWLLFRFRNGGISGMCICLETVLVGILLKTNPIYKRN